VRCANLQFVDRQSRAIRWLHVRDFPSKSRAGKMVIQLTVQSGGHMRHVAALGTQRLVAVMMFRCFGFPN